MNLKFNFTLEKNEFRADMRGEINDSIVGISGPSGAGKTTFFNVLCGVETPMNGYIALNDKILFDSINKINIPISNRKMGVVFQDDRLFPHMKVRNNLLYGFNLLKKSERKLFLEDVCELLEIEELLERYPHEISGGQRKRIGIGRALLTSPELLLMDEPFSALDLKLRNSIIQKLKIINEELKIPLLLISHYNDDFANINAVHHEICEGRYFAMYKAHKMSFAH